MLHVECISAIQSLPTLIPCLEHTNEKNLNTRVRGNPGPPSDKFSRDLASDFCRFDSLLLAHNWKFEHKTCVGIIFIEIERSIVFLGNIE